MNHHNLTLEDQSIVAACLNAAATGPFFPEWEFHTLFGLEHKEMAEVATRWLDFDLSTEDVEVAVVGAMNNLLGYPHGYSLEATIGHGPEAIRTVLVRVLTA